MGARRLFISRSSFSEVSAGSSGRHVRPRPGYPFAILIGLVMSEVPGIGRE